MAQRIVILDENEYAMLERCKAYVEHTLIQVERRERERSYTNTRTPMFKTSDYLKSILKI